MRIINKALVKVLGRIEIGIENRKQAKKLSQRNKKKSDHLEYAVVSAVYNVESYLDEYFTSLVNQTLDFQNNIFLYLVDDGSTDQSGHIIKQWAAKYPKNIKYIRKDNGGQASARNLGLKLVTQSWVTFIDSDDFVKQSYFEVIDGFLERDVNHEISLISCNLKFYVENMKEVKDHYLSSRFKAREIIVSPANMQGRIQTTANSVLFQTEKLRESSCEFLEKIKPAYEDGFFVNQFLLSFPEVNIAFLQKAEYFYRKRSDSSSTMDNAWQNPARFTDAIEFGLLDLLVLSKEKDREVPKYLQRYVLYHLSWYFKKLVFLGFSTEHISGQELNKFRSLLESIFFYLDSDVIESCSLGALTHRYKMGLLSLYKNKVEFLPVFYIDAYCSDSQIMGLHYYYIKPLAPVFMLNNQVLDIINEVDIEHCFFEKTFVHEKKISLKVSGVWEYFTVYSNTENTELSVCKKRYKNGIQFRLLSEKLNSLE